MYQVDILVTAEERRRSSGVHVAVVAPQVRGGRVCVLGHNFKLHISWTGGGWHNIYAHFALRRCTDALAEHFPPCFWTVSAPKMNNFSTHKRNQNIGDG